MNKKLLLVIISVLVSGCGGDAPSESEIKAEFDVAVEVSRECETDEQCVLVYAGCPLGCSAAVNADSEEYITNLAARLISEYERNGSRCEYSCLAVRPVCSDNLCGSVPF